MKRWVLFFLLAAAVVFSARAGTCDDKPRVLRVATFRCDVTPPADGQFRGGWAQPLTSVIDPLWSKGIVLDDGSAFVGDLVQGPRIPKIFPPEFSIMAVDEPAMFASWLFTRGMSARRRPMRTTRPVSGEKRPPPSKYPMPAAASTMPSGLRCTLPRRSTARVKLSAWLPIASLKARASSTRRRP